VHKTAIVYKLKMAKQLKGMFV